MRKTDKRLSAEEKQTLRLLWDRVPRLSVRAIGKIMGRSHDSIVGHAHRMKLSPRESPLLPPVAPKIHPERQAYSVKEPLPFACDLAMRILREAPRLDV